MGIRALRLTGLLSIVLGHCVSTGTGFASPAQVPRTPEASPPSATAAGPTATPAPPQPGPGVATARNLTLAQGDLISPAEFTVSLPNTIFRMRPSEYWPSEALAGYVCDDVSLKSIRIWKRKDRTKSAVYGFEFDVYVHEGAQKLVEIAFSVMKGSAKLGARKILAADCEANKTTTLRGQAELPTAEFEAMFSDGSRPALVIVLRAQSNLGDE